MERSWLSVLSVLAVALVVDAATCIPSVLPTIACYFVHAFAVLEHLRILLFDVFTGGMVLFSGLLWLEHRRVTGRQREWPTVRRIVERGAAARDHTPFAMGLWTAAIGAMVLSWTGVIPFYVGFVVGTVAVLTFDVVALLRTIHRYFDAAAETTKDWSWIDNGGEEFVV